MDNSEIREKVGMMCKRLGEDFSHKHSLTEEEWTLWLSFHATLFDMNNNEEQE